MHAFGCITKQQYHSKILVSSAFSDDNLSDKNPGFIVSNLHSTAYQSNRNVHFSPSVAVKCVESLTVVVPSACQWWEYMKCTVISQLCSRMRLLS